MQLIYPVKLEKISFSAYGGNYGDIFDKEQINQLRSIKDWLKLVFSFLGFLEYNVF